MGKTAPLPTLMSINRLAIPKIRLDEKIQTSLTIIRLDKPFLTRKTKKNLNHVK